MIQVAKYLGVFLLWNLIVGFFLFYTPPAFGLPAALMLSGLLLWGYLLRDGRRGDPARRWATLRLRPLSGSTLRWTAAAIPVLLVFAWALGDVYTRLIPVPPESLNPFEEILATPAGRMAVAIFAVAVAPIVEEFLFRGLIQRHMERRYGVIVGIGGASALFALVHVLPWVYPLHFFLGVSFGFAVWATRSIWTGVVLHAANNSAAMVGLALSGDEPGATATLWEVGVTADLWVSLFLLAVAGVAAVWVARNLMIAGGRATLRTL
jgi:membrane protease YdiL (CAAX protease family)